MASADQAPAPPGTHAGQAEEHPVKSRACRFLAQDNPSPRGRVGDRRTVSTFRHCLLHKGARDFGAKLARFASPPIVKIYTSVPGRQISPPPSPKQDCLAAPVIRSKRRNHTKRRRVKWSRPWSEPFMTGHPLHLEHNAVSAAILDDQSRHFYAKCFIKPYITASRNQQTLTNFRHHRYLRHIKKAFS